MQIGTNHLFDVNIARMRQRAAEAAEWQTQIATGKRLTAPSADAVAYDRVTLLKRSMANEEQYTANVGVARSVLEQSDGALAGVEAQLQRANELAIRASTATMSQNDRAAMAVELQNILDDLFTTANGTDIRGTPLFGGAGSAPAFVRDANGVVSYAGSGEAAPIPISESATVITNESGARVFGTIETGSGVRDLFSIVGDLAAALGPNGPTDPAALRAEMERGMDGLAAAVEHIAVSRASIGARGARLELEGERLAQRSIDQDIERSGLEDADITETVPKLQQALLTLQATQASFAKLSQLSLFDYIR